MKRTKLVTVLVILAAIFITVFLIADVIIPSAKSILTLENRIFADISEFNAVDEYIVDSASDKYLKVEPVYAYSNTLLWNNKEFNVYAYVFDSVSDAQEYFELSTGRESDLEFNFLLTSNYFTTAQYVVYNGNAVFRVTSRGSKDFVEFIHFVNSNFTIDL